MLPVETFTDVVSFLGYYDLGGLKLTNKMFSAVANRCAEAIRLFDFSDFSFDIYGSFIDVWRLESNRQTSWVCYLELSREESLAEFISDAFRNCTVGRFSLRARQAHVQNAIRLVANTVAVAGTLEISLGAFKNEQELFELVDSFRRVQRLAVWSSSRLIETETLKNFCQRKNIALHL